MNTTCKNERPHPIAAHRSTLSLHDSPKNQTRPPHAQRPNQNHRPNRSPPRTDQARPQPTLPTPQSTSLQSHRQLHPPRQIPQQNRNKLNRTPSKTRRLQQTRHPRRQTRQHLPRQRPRRRGHPVAQMNQANFLDAGCRGGVISGSSTILITKSCRSRRRHLHATSDYEISCNFSGIACPTIPTQYATSA